VRPSLSIDFCAAGVYGFFNFRQALPVGAIQTKSVLQYTSLVILSERQRTAEIDQVVLNNTNVKSPCLSQRSLTNHISNEGLLAPLLEERGWGEAIPIHRLLRSRRLWIF